MRFVLELRGRFLTLETGRIYYDEPEPPADEDDEPEPVIHVPMGFTAIAPERTDDDDEDEAPEADCY